MCIHPFFVAYPLEGQTYLISYPSLRFLYIFGDPGLLCGSRCRGNCRSLINDMICARPDLSRNFNRFFSVASLFCIVAVSLLDQSHNTLVAPGGISSLKRPCICLALNNYRPLKLLRKNKNHIWDRLKKQKKTWYPPGFELGSFSILGQRAPSRPEILSIRVRY